MTTFTQGNAASGATDEGNPVKVGGVFRTTQPTVTDGQRVDQQFDNRGNLKAVLIGSGSTSGVPSADGSADGQGTATLGLVTRTYNLEFNGTTWDRLVKANQTSRLLSAAASTNATVVKGSAGNVFKVFGVNTNAAARYLKFYNKATAPTIGTDTPVLTLYLPPSTVNGGQFSFDLSKQYFATGIGYGMTTAAADADTGALTAGDVVALNITYS